MIPIPIIKGSAISKTSGTTLVSESDVFMVGGDSMTVGVTYDTGEGPPVVTWGNRELSEIVSVEQGGVGTASFLLRHINNNGTKAVTCTWPGAITAKTMIIVSTTGVNLKDVLQSNGQTSTGSPATGTAVTSNIADTLSIAFFGSHGPEGDTQGSAGVGHTLLGRRGTTGGAPATNVTIQATYEILAATGNVRATLTGATSRVWANVIVALKRSIANRQGISPSDIQLIGIAADAGGYKQKDIILYYQGSLDRWEARIDSRTGTLVAHSGNNWA